MSLKAELPGRSNYDCVGVSENLPQTFKREITAILDGAKVGGAISPRRHSGLLVELARVKDRYDDKIANMRGRGLSVDEAEAAIDKASAEFSATLSQQ